jgi:hypothetical protein
MQFDFHYTWKLVDIFEFAARADRLMPGPKKPTAPSMYKILDVIHDKSDHGLYRAGVIRLRATDKMIECFELAIDLLLLLTTEQRQIIWSRANNYSYSEIGKMLGIERRKVKRHYLDALFDCERKFKQNKLLLAKVDKIY